MAGDDRRVRWGFDPVEGGDWRVRRACTPPMANLFFSFDAAEIVMAKSVCAECLVRQECLDFAMATHQENGVWGGLDATELAKKRRRR